jgi:hypothetical protein
MNKSTLFMSRILLTIIGAAFFSLMLVVDSQAKILKAVTDSFDGATRSAPSRITLVETPRRAGTHAFKHVINNDTERAEIGGLTDGRVGSGSTHWYGFSFMHMSEPAIPSGDFTILMQHFQGDRSASAWPCGGGGHKLTLAPDKQLQYHLQYQSGGSIKCERFNLTNFDQIKDKWVDVVIHVKWTAQGNGFFKLWIRIGGDSGTWSQKINYTGATMASGEGPYVGNPNSGSRLVYTDEYRFADADSTFDDVAPGGKGTPTPTPQPELTHTIQLQQNWNLISLPINPSDTDIADVLAPINGQYVAVHAYDGKEYESYYPGNNDSKLKKMESGRGFWIFMNQAASLQIKGTKASKDVMLAKDWNLVGYNSQTPMSATQALASTGGKVSAVYSYDAVSNSYKVVDMFQPGSGYWMFASDNVKWTLP